MHWLCFLFGHQHWVRIRDYWEDMPFDNYKWVEHCVRCKSKEAREWVQENFTPEQIKDAKKLSGVPNK